MDSLEDLGLYMADMDASDTVKIYSVKKHYDGGGVDGHYEIKINPVTLTSVDLYERYDLSAPIYKFDGYTGTGITTGVRKGSTGIRDLNDVASNLFNTLLCGEVALGRDRRRWWWRAWRLRLRRRVPSGAYLSPSRDAPRPGAQSSQLVRSSDDICPRSHAPQSSRAS